MSPATIKKPLIGKFGKIFDISQTDLPKMYLDENVFGVIELTQLAGRLEIDEQSIATITSATTYNLDWIVPNNKRYQLLQLHLYGATGVWTSNSTIVSIIPANRPTLTEGWRMWYSVANVNGTTYNFIEETNLLNPFIFLNPGDRIRVSIVVNSYTSGTGTLNLRALVTAWDL